MVMCTNFPQASWWTANKDLLWFPPDETNSGLNQVLLSLNMQINSDLLFGKAYSIIAFKTLPNSTEWQNVQQSQFPGKTVDLLA